MCLKKKSGIRSTYVEDNERLNAVLLDHYFRVFLFCCLLPLGLENLYSWLFFAFFAVFYIDGSWNFQGLQLREWFDLFEHRLTVRYLGKLVGT